jgi:hypothetical protein
MAGQVDMKNEVFEQFITTVGTNGTLTLSLLDAETGGIPALVAGPGYRRNPIRFFAKMPNLKEAERLPAPLRCDRKTVSFAPISIVLDSPLPPHYTASFHRMIGGKEKGSLAKRAVHMWSPLEDTALYPAIAIRMPSIKPGETIEIEGVSYWYNERRTRRQNNPYHYPLPAESPPPVISRMPVSLRILIKMTWLPMETGKKRIQVVDGSPLQESPYAFPMDPPRNEADHEPISMPEARQKRL